MNLDLWQRLTWFGILFPAAPILALILWAVW
jgi:hypothetical protein